MNTLKDCVLCYNEFEEEGVCCDETQKLTEICCKYFHSSITQMSSNHTIRDKSSFCKECFKFVEELYNINDKMELCQKQISDLVFKRQLEILLRRSGSTPSNSEIGSNYIKSWRQLIEFGLSTVSNENVSSGKDFSNINTPTDIYDEVFPDQLVIPSSDIVAETVNVTFEQIKVDRGETDLIHALNEVNNATGDIDADLFLDTEILISGVSTVTTDNKKLNYCGNTISITEKRDNIGAGQIFMHTDGTEKDSRSSFKIADGIETSSHEGFKRRLLHGCTSTKTSGSLSNPQISEERVCHSSSTSHGGKLPSDLIEPHSKIDECQVKEKEQQELQKILQQTHSKQNNSKKCLPDESKKVCRKVVLQPKVGHKDNEKMSVNHSGKGFSEQNGLISHKRVHSEKRLYKCEVCEKGFKEKHNLKRHRIVHSGEKPYGCEFCVKRFAAKRDLNEHFRVHTREKPFKCVTCGMEFAQKSNFRRHVRIHSSEKPSSTSLIRNRSIHLIESDNKKVHCNVKDKEQQELRNVLPQNHSKQNNSKKYQPDESEKVWRKVSQPKIGHTDKGEINRAITGKGFSQQSGLINHKRAHSEERLDKIVVSGKAFGEKSSADAIAIFYDDGKDFKGWSLPDCTPIKTSGSLSIPQISEERICNSSSTSHVGKLSSDVIESHRKIGQCQVKEKQQQELQEILQQTHSKVNNSKKCIPDETKKIWRKVLQTKIGNTYKGEMNVNRAVSGKGITQQSDLTNHEYVHSEEQLNKTVVSGKAFGEKSNLKSHREDRNGEKPYTCTICDKRFDEKYNLNRHVKIHIGEKPYVCKLCEKRFLNKSNLKRHLKTHSKERPYKCEVCPRTFGEKADLKRHGIRVHTGEKPYNCAFCGKRFTEKRDLSDHIKIHTGEKPFKCDVCGKEFRVSSNLYRHQKIHLKERPHKCEFCEKRFAQKSYLNDHIRIHTGEKPFKCDICGKEFRVSRNLYRHQKIHLKERPSYKCKACDIGFKESSSLSRHKKRFHIGEKL